MEFPGLSAVLRESGVYACQYVARTQASRQLSVRFWPALSTNSRNRRRARKWCSKKMRRGSESEAPRAANTFDGAPAPHLCILPAESLMGATPSYGEPLLSFPPDARPWCSVGGLSAARQMSPTVDVETLLPPLRYRRGAIGREGNAGTCAAQFECRQVSYPALCRRIRGWGGWRFLGVCPVPIPHSSGAWRTIRWSMPEVCLLI